MKLAHYRADGVTRIGIVRGREVYDLKNSPRAGPRGAGLGTIDDLLANGTLERLVDEGKDLALGKGLPIDSVKLASPVLRPQKILLIAVNYKAHGREQSVKPPSEPYFFTKFSNALIGDGDPIVIPRDSRKVDWEVELAVIIGKKGRYVPKSKAMEHVAGYCVANDVSFRDLQFPPGWPDKVGPLGQNWVMGKGLDGSLPLGPWLLTADEIEDPYRLQLTLKVNGSVKQKAPSSDMVFGIDDMIAYLSRGMTLMPGDVISTGTPSGVAVFSGEPFLKAGDLVEASITRVGTLRNPVVEEHRN